MEPIEQPPEPQESGSPPAADKIREASVRQVGCFLAGQPNLSFRVHVYEAHSQALAGNPLGDPVKRQLLVLLPPGYDLVHPKPLPHLWILPSFGGTGRTLLNFSPTGEDLRERLDRLYAQKAIGPLVVILPDTFTRLGGNQHIDSAGVGLYESYLWQELRPWVEARFPVNGRAVAGKSSGGYGALMNALRHPGLFDAVACHSGDMAFDLCYLPQMVNLLREVARAGGLARWREQVLVIGSRSHPDAPTSLSRAFHSAMGLYAMACTYSPNLQAEGGVDLPVDLTTGELRADVWQRWLQQDPAWLLAQPALRGPDSPLRRPRLLYFDCGDQDEFGLNFGARRLHRRLEEAGIPHLYESYAGGHFDTSYRYDRSLPLIWQALSQPR